MRRVQGHAVFCAVAAAFGLVTVVEVARLDHARTVNAARIAYSLMCPALRT